MRSDRTKRKQSNKKRLLIYLVLGGIFVGFFLREESPREHDPSPEPSSLDRLKSLPYLSWTPAKNIAKSGVTRFDSKKSLSGINIYKSGDVPEAYLMDMTGNVLHTWTAKTESDDTWSNIELSNQGDLFVFLNYERLIRLDWNSTVTWRSDNLGFHHDIAISKDEEIYALTRRIEYIPQLSLTHRTANDYITILSQTGDLKKSLSIEKLLRDAKISVIHVDIEPDYPRVTNLANVIERLESDKETDNIGRSFLLAMLKKVDPYYDKLTRPKDFFHTNTIEIIDAEAFDGAHELFKTGDILVCIRNQNLIALVDIEEERIVWSWGRTELEHPHDPVLLDSGDLLIFDNGYKRKYSRIIQLDPVTREIVWEYKAVPPEEFFSETRGSNQKLANGNVLIADSRNGRAFEITHDGEIVWEFYNPDIRIGDEENQRATIFRMRRITDLEKHPLARRLK